MKVKIKNELIPLNLLIFVLIFVIFFSPSNVLRVILGFPFMLFFPGYALMAALMPRKTALDAIERVALSFGTSLVAVLFIGLLLNYTPWGITVESTLYATSIFILVMSIIAWARRKRLGEAERFVIEFRLGLPKWGSSRWDKLLTVVMVIAILVAVGVLVNLIVTPKESEKFTEFYILSGEAGSYPENLSVGKEAKAAVGIINREYERVSYRIVVKLNDEEIGVSGLLTFEHGEKRELEVAFTPRTAGANQRVDFLLYRGGQAEIYRWLHLWVDVSQ